MTWSAGCLAMVLVAGPVLAVAQAEAAQVDGFDPSGIDMAGLIECQYDVGDYNGFAFWLVSEEAPEKPLGMTKVDSPNPFLSQYELAAPITVFGYETRTVVFTSAGPMAVLDTPDAAKVAGDIGVPAALDTPGKFLGEKVVVEETEHIDDTELTYTIKLNVSTVSSHPGKTLAGCTYTLDVETPE